MKNKDKLYIIIRSDLFPGNQIAQATHICFQYAKEHFQETIEWMNTSNHICVLEIENEEKLKELLQKAKDKNIMHSAFFESDMNNELTAIALAPSNKTKKLCYNMKLALSQLN